MKTEKDLEQESKTEKLLQINDKLMQNITELEEKVSSANTRLIKAEEITLKKQSRNTELEIKISQLEKQLETIPILTTQVKKEQSRSHYHYHVWIFLMYYNFFFLSFFFSYRLNCIKLISKQNATPVRI